MNETSGQSSKPDAVEYARIMLYQLAALRAEAVETRNMLTLLYCQSRGQTHEQYLERVADQGKRMDAEIERIFRASLEMANIPYKAIPKKESQDHERQ